MGNRKPVIVVGAGPAGLACGLWLARGGLEVTVLESSPELGPRPCGEGIMPPGVRLLEQLGLVDAARAAGAEPITGIAYWSGGELAAEADFPAWEGRPSFGLAVRRPGFDRVLLEALRREPLARVRLGTPVTDLLFEGPRVAGVVSAKESFAASAVVGADGMRSRVRERLKLSGTIWCPGERFGVCGHFEWDSPRPQPLNRVEVHLVEGGELYRAAVGPAAEGWIFLTGRETVRRWAGRFEALIAERAAASPPLAAALSGARPVGPFTATGPFARRARRLHAPGALLIGDAAGYLDPLTGEGLAIGLQGAQVAAQLLLASHGLVDDAVGGQFERWWRDATRDPWRLTRAVVFLVRWPTLGRFALRRLGRHPETMSRLLAVNAGDLRFSGLPLSDYARLLFG